MRRQNPPYGDEKDLKSPPTMLDTNSAKLFGNVVQVDVCRDEPRLQVPINIFDIFINYLNDYFL